MRNTLIAALTCVSLTAFAAPPASTPALLAKGKASYGTNCVPCHGEQGHGDGPAAVALNPKPRDYTKDTLKNGDKVEDIFKTLTEGLKGTTMVSFAHLPEEERWALAYHVTELRKAGGAGTAAAVPDAGTAPAKKTGKAKK
ncbi:MAG: cytochrome c [Myxococcaceae bacterium]|nr:cytochrome c [Myxococcaceae bacterium]